MRRKKGSISSRISSRCYRLLSRNLMGAPADRPLIVFSSPSVIRLACHIHWRRRLVVKRVRRSRARGWSSPALLVFRQWCLGRQRRRLQSRGWRPALGRWRWTRVLVGAHNGNLVGSGAVAELRWGRRTDDELVAVFGMRRSGAARVWSRRQSSRWRGGRACGERPIVGAARGDWRSAVVVVEAIEARVE